MIEDIKKKIEEGRTPHYNLTIINTKKAVYGVKYPELAKMIQGLKQEEIENLIQTYDDSSFELSIIEAMLIGKVKSYDKAFMYLNNFLPYVDNWATSDKLSQAFRILRKQESAINDVLPFLLDDNPWKVRGGLILILSHLLPIIDFDLVFNTIDQIHATGYYVDMGIAWLLAEMAFYDAKKVFDYLKRAKISSFTNNKTLSKIRESNKIPKEIKEVTYKYKRQANYIVNP